MAQRAKTSGDTTVPPLVQQEHGGSLRAGGTPGNRGGRPANAFRAEMRRLTNSAKAVSYLRECLEGEHGSSAAIQAWKFAASYAYGQPPAEVELKGLLARVDFKAWPDQLIHEFTTSRDPMGVLASWASRGIELLSPATDAELLDEDDPEVGES